MQQILYVWKREDASKLLCTQTLPQSEIAVNLILNPVDHLVQTYPLCYIFLMDLTPHPDLRFNKNTNCPKLMGIVNVTPDSFSDGGQFLAPMAAWQHAQRLVSQGADLLDIGAESTRPGAIPVSAQEEWGRLEPVLQLLQKDSVRVPLSVDTRHPETARQAVALGVNMLNLPFPQTFLSQTPNANRVDLLCAFENVVLMHSRGTPITMQQHTTYPLGVARTVCKELLQWIEPWLAYAPEIAGRLIYDPGIGFAKTAQQSLTLLGQLSLCKNILQGPILVGLSRKSFLEHATGLPTSQRQIPSVVAAVLAAQQGSDFVRVHDVAETKAAFALLSAVTHAATLDKT